MVKRYLCKSSNSLMTVSTVVAIEIDLWKFVTPTTMLKLELIDATGENRFILLFLLHNITQRKLSHFPIVFCQYVINIIFRDTWLADSFDTLHLWRYRMWHLSFYFREEIFTMKMLRSGKNEEGKTAFIDLYCWYCNESKLFANLWVKLTVSFTQIHNWNLANVVSWLNTLLTMSLKMLYLLSLKVKQEEK